MIDSPIITSNKETVLPPCPVGESQCDVIDQLSALHKEVGILNEQVRTDTLTGLYNFRHFTQSLTLEMERTCRTGQPTALIMVDLDHFKKINDTWGHEVGNQVLVCIAKVLRQTTRQLDIPCRYGGEEFAVILPCVDLMVSIQIAERIRAMIEATPLNAGAEDIHLSASLGIAIYDGGQFEKADDFVARADNYLYKAKAAGRNRVCHEVKERKNANISVSEAEKDALFGHISNDNQS